MIPYHDENETRRTAVVTLGIIAACILVWLFVQGAGMGLRLAASVCNYGLIPGELTQLATPGTGFPIDETHACIIDQGPEYLNILYSMFLHGSWMHLIGNMWFLWLFGNNIEDSMSRPRFLAFYLLCGLAAAMLQVFVDPKSSIPMVGASGAISGVMGAYLLLFPRVRVYTLVFLGLFVTSFGLPAWVMLIYWFVLQLLGGFTSIGAAGGGTAFWAHVGGFAAGLILIKLFVKRDHLYQRSNTSWRPDRVGWR